MTSPLSAAPDYIENQANGAAKINLIAALLERGPAPCHVEDRNVTNPSALTPTNGQAWLLTGTGAGVWAGHVGSTTPVLMTYLDGTWYPRNCQEGEQFYIRDEKLLAYLYPAAGQLWVRPVQPIIPTSTGVVYDTGKTTSGGKFIWGVRLRVPSSGSLALGANAVAHGLNIDVSTASYKKVTATVGLGATSSSGSFNLVPAPFNNSGVVDPQSAILVSFPNNTQVVVQVDATASIWVTNGMVAWIDLEYINP